MKALKSLLFYFIFLINSIAQIVPGQPEYIGMNAGAFKHATLFTERYYFTSIHNFPANGRELTFGNGEKGIVKQTFQIRKGALFNEYDLAIGELVKPVSAKPVEVWWSLPADFTGNEIQVTGFGAKGWYLGTKGHVEKGSYLPELHKGLWFSSPLGIIESGYSGSPVFFRGRLVGLIWGTWRNDSSQPGSLGGLVNPIQMVFEDFWYLLPNFIQPPLEPSISIKKEGNQLLLYLKTPGGKQTRITAASNLSGPWEPVEERPGFLGYDEYSSKPWEKVMRFDPSRTSKMFFRGEASPK